ncbi:hypothetical protein Pcinc_017720 [Petrolisthes cinctipes]|uniref:Uncharacterized protein n=1 Tax=Petrolisthes cinctipes TaxID=88211 RepID=A0AAE1FNL4_PETCI|nr:hypothetical protein Pcinc_017720 [Petrolisthes cinctipes]
MPSRGTGRQAEGKWVWGVKQVDGWVRGCGVSSRWMDGPHTPSSRWFSSSLADHVTLEPRDATPSSAPPSRLYPF